MSGCQANPALIDALASLQNSQPLYGAETAVEQRCLLEYFYDATLLGKGIELLSSCIVHVCSSLAIDFHQETHATLWTGSASALHKIEAVTSGPRVAHTRMAQLLPDQKGTSPANLLTAHVRLVNLGRQHSSAASHHSLQ